MSSLLFAGLCRRLKFSIKINEYRLQFHVIKKFNLSIYVGPSMRSACTHRCIMDPVCVSVNIGPSTDEEFICELSDSDHMKHPEDLKKQEGFLYIGTEVIKFLWAEDIFSVILILALDTKANCKHLNVEMPEEVYFLVIRTRASVTRVFMVQFAWTNIRTNSIIVNAKQVTRGNNVKKVRLFELTSNIVKLPKLLKRYCLIHRIHKWRNARVSLGTRTRKRGGRG